MTFKSARLLTLIAVGGLALAGCGRPTPQLALPAEMPRKGTVAAKAVTPDGEFAKDLRRALYWRGDAVHVMAIHATGLNTPAISASANIFFSPSAYHREQPAVFVARHYGFSSVAQYRETNEFVGVAKGLKPLTKVTIQAEQAWKLAKNYKPANPDPTQKPPGRFFIGTRAVLIDNGAASWHFYAGSEKFAINANDGSVLAPTPRVDPNDPLPHHDPVKDGDVELQRASMVWLPTNLGQPNAHQQR